MYFWRFRSLHCPSNICIYAPECRLRLATTEESRELRNRQTPICSSANGKTAPGASGKDNGVDARLITTARGLGPPLRMNDAAKQCVRHSRESLHDRATVLLPISLQQVSMPIIQLPGNRVGMLHHGSQWSRYSQDAQTYPGDPRRPKPGRSKCINVNSR